MLLLPFAGFGLRWQARRCELAEDDVMVVFATPVPEIDHRVNSRLQIQQPNDHTMKSQKDAEEEVRGWGFRHVFTWTDGP